MKYQFLTGLHPNYSSFTKKQRTAHITLLLPRNGTLWVAINSPSSNESQRIALLPGVGFLLGPQNLYSLQLQNVETDSFYVLTLDPTEEFALTPPEWGKEYVTPVLSWFHAKTLLLEEDNLTTGNLLLLFKEMLHREAVPAPGSVLYTTGLFFELWYLLFSLAKNLQKSDWISPLQQGLTPDDRVGQAVRLIEVKYMEPLTLDDIAAVMLVSRSECCRSFKKVLGQTPFEYLQRYRIYIAAQKILQNQYSSLAISELSYSVGFNNASYFNKLFKKYLGCTPSQYKKKGNSHQLLEILLYPTEQNKCETTVDQTQCP